MSVKVTREMTTIPPPPMPWTARPASSWPILCDAAQMMVPMVNSETDATRVIGLPKISEKEAKNDMATAVDSK